MPLDLEKIASQAELLPRGFARSLERPFQILRYYRKRQLLRRLWDSTLGSRLKTNTVAEVRKVQFAEDVRNRLDQLFQLRVVRTDRPLKELQADLKIGVFRFLNQRRELGMPIDWSGSSQDNSERLWQFHLHYQEYLLDVATNSNAETWELIQFQINDWLDAHSSESADGRGDPWHSYCISRRIPIWLQLLANGKFEQSFRQRMLCSIAQQADFLRQNPEVGLGGNHLLENARTLALAGCALQVDFANSTGQEERWLTAAEAILHREMPKQLLAHGEHFERSPMYHCQILGNLLQIAFLAMEVRPSLAQACCEWAKPMSAFLQSILHPDGEIPLFGDSCFGETYPVEELQRLQEIMGISVPDEPVIDEDSKPSPYWVARTDNDAWVVDFGDAVADTLPAHGHCDLMNFEASIDGVRWIVDSGLYGYGDDLMRRYCRSSWAHNVVTVGDRNQFDIWSRFRMGYRARPSKLLRGEQAGFTWAQSSHAAYRRVGVNWVERVVAANQSGVWICLENVPSQNRNQITGRLHLSSRVRLREIENGDWELTCGKVVRVLQFLGTSSVKSLAGWHAPRFGQREPSTVLEYTLSPEEAIMGWCLAPLDTSPPICFRVDNSRTSQELASQERQTHLQWSFAQGETIVQVFK